MAQAAHSMDCTDGFLLQDGGPVCHCNISRSPPMGRLHYHKMHRDLCLIISESILY